MAVAAPRRRLRILVADIAGPDKVRDPVAEFLGIRPGQPPPSSLIWRGHEMIIRHGISFEEALRLKPDFVMGLMGWSGISRKRSEFYLKFFALGVPVFTWGNDSEIPYLMKRTAYAGKDRPSRRIVIARPDHPIMRGVRPEDIRPSGEDSRSLVVELQPYVIGLAYDPDNSSWEIIYVEALLGTRRWLHYHPHPCPPRRLIDNMLEYMTEPARLPAVVGGIAGAAIGAGIGYLAARLLKKRARLGALVGGGAGAAAGALGLHWFLSPYIGGAIVPRHVAVTEIAETAE
jgi:hypothetical protein